MSLSEELLAFNINGHWDDSEDLDNAIEWVEQHEAYIHEEVLTVFRYSSSPMSGDEIEDTGFIIDKQTSEVCFYWRDNASGMVRTKIGQMPTQDIGAWLSKLMGTLGYTFNQFVGCELLNRSPKLLSKAAVYTIIEESFKRWDADYTETPLPQWFAGQYSEVS